MAVCNLCYRHCNISEGKYGFCQVRTCRDGIIVPENYGMLTAIAMDPIEKKPLNRFYPGSYKADGNGLYPEGREALPCGADNSDYSRGE